MKSETNSPYILIFSVVKASGYVFFSLISSKDRIQFEKKRKDFGIMLISLLFSFCVIAFARSDKFSLTRSLVLNIAIAFLWDLAMVSSILTKLINVFKGRKMFDILKQL